jgi:hypothetical protein
VILGVKFTESIEACEPARRLTLSAPKGNRSPYPALCCSYLSSLQSIGVNLGSVAKLVLSSSFSWCADQAGTEQIDLGAAVPRTIHLWQRVRDRGDGISRSNRQQRQDDTFVAKFGAFGLKVRQVVNRRQVSCFLSQRPCESTGLRVIFVASDEAPNTASTDPPRRGGRHAMELANEIRRPRSRDLSAAGKEKRATGPERNRSLRSANSHVYRFSIMFPICLVRAPLVPCS